MTEEEWLAAIPSLMMHHIGQVAPASARKLRLLAIAYARFLESQPDYADAKHVSHLGEAVVEGSETLESLWDDRRRGWGYDGDWSIANLVLAGDDQLDMATRTAMWISEDRAERANLDTSERRRVAQSHIRCVLGNPFRPVTLDHSWISSNVVDLARTIYDERAFERLPILADALMDAGCADEQMLKHCRSKGPHVRGCWVVDLVLGKE
jgi:hypothetical protein